MKKLLSLVVTIVTLGSGFTQAQLVPNPCNSENSSSSDCAISTYQAIYCPDPCQPLNDIAKVLALAAKADCLRAPGTPACDYAVASATAAFAAAGLCEAANAVSYTTAYALCELGL
jgi:hypothetical protein